MALRNKGSVLQGRKRAAHIESDSSESETDVEDEPDLGESDSADDLPSEPEQASDGRDLQEEWQSF